MATQGPSQQTTKNSPYKSSSNKTNNALTAPSLEGNLQRAVFDTANAQPQDILRLQRAVGNRTVSTLIQQRTAPIPQPKLMVGPADDRYEREADQVANRVMRAPAPVIRRHQDEEESAQRQTVQRDMAPRDIVQREGEQGEGAQRDLKSSAEGFTADKNFTSQLNASKGGGKSLPNETRSFMEGRFNADFGGVRIHTGDSASKLNSSIQAKAFTHGNNIYFNQGSYAPGSNSGKQLLAHELTHVVQQGAAVQRTSDLPAGAQTPVIRRKTEGRIQRGLMSWIKGKFAGKKEGGEKNQPTPPTKKPLKHDPTNVAKADTMREDAVVFERNLGRFASNHSKANGAAKTVMDKMTNVLIGDIEEGNVEQEKQIVATYGKDKASSAGQVGTNVKALLGVLKEGNLRERMTALMNAMFGPFKQYVLQGMKDAAWGEMAKKGLNVDKLKRRKKQMTWNLGAKDLYRDPGNPLDRKNLSTWQRTGATRFDKNDSAAQTTKRTAGDLDQGNFPISLSEREKELQFPGKKDDVSGENLKWQEGGSYWAVNHKNKWVKKVEESLHMPIIAGPSGTMLRMFQTWEYLSKPVPAADWRLAVMGWMLAANDHSFHEMMLTAADYGLPYTPGPQAYMNIPPLSVQELRKNVAEKGLFPHELALTRKVEGGGIKHLLEDTDLTAGNDAADDFAKKPEEERGALSGPGAAAIELYTRFGYLVLNPARKGGMFAGKQIERNAKNKDEMDHFKDDFESGKLTAKDLMNEAADIIPVLDSALETLPDWSGDLFRGTGTFSPFSYRKGATVKFGAYTSSTLDETTAKGFADDYNIGPFKYILHLKTTAGKDVRELSAAAEDEILLPPGSVFTVTDRKSPDSGRAYYHVYLEQTARGGMGLKLTPDKDSLSEGAVKVDEKPVKSGPPTVIQQIVLKPNQYIDACDEKGKSLGSIRPGETIGATGVTNGSLVQYVWEGQIYWMRDSWWDMYFDQPYPDAVLDSDDSETSEDDSGGGGGSPSTPTVVKPKADTLTLYNSDDKAVDELTSPDDIAMDDLTQITNDEGVEWTEISTLIGTFYWVKTAELKAFQGKDYVPVSSGSVITPSSGGGDSGGDSIPMMSAPTVSKEETVVQKPVGNLMPKLEKLTLYDQDENEQDEMSSASEIDDPDFASFVNEETGVEWKEIATKGSGFYWVKAAELAAFLGVPYAPPKSGSKSSNKSDEVDDELVENF